MHMLSVRLVSGARCAEFCWPCFLSSALCNACAGGDVLERGGPVWSGVYPPGSSLQHAAQLQLLSQQQMLRQQELLMIQQHTAQVLELQRNAQFVVSGFKLRT